MNEFYEKIAIALIPSLGSMISILISYLLGNLRNKNENELS